MFRIWFCGYGNTAAKACRYLSTFEGNDIEVFTPEKNPLADTASERKLTLHSASSILEIGKDYCDWPDLLISFLFPIVVPVTVLNSIRYGGINFHPAPLPRFRGVHCSAFAIAERAEKFGVTCHRMGGLIDDGPVLDYLDVDILEDDDESRLEERAKNTLLYLFYQTMQKRIWETNNATSIMDEGRSRLYTKKDYIRLKRNESS